MCHVSNSKNYLRIHIIALRYGLFVIWLLLGDGEHPGLCPYRASKHIQYKGHHITESPSLLLVAWLNLFRGDIDRNIQGINTCIQARHVRTHDTCALPSWPTAHLNTARNLYTSHKSSRKLVSSSEMGAWRVNFASISERRLWHVDFQLVSHLNLHGLDLLYNN